MDLALVPQRTAIIPFHDEPFEIRIRGGSPLYELYNESIRTELKAAWSQYLTDLTAMIHQKEWLKKLEKDKQSYETLMEYKKTKRTCQQ
jgi:hypothetical protein